MKQRVEVLDREMYSGAEAARLLGLHQGTLHYWLDGGTRRGKTYKPVIRTEARQKRTVTWVEFVEAALLREYRRTLGVPMTELRAFIDGLREEYDVPYPLAHRQPLVSGKTLYDLQAESGLAAEYCLVAYASGQYVLTPPSQSYMDRVVWVDDIAAGWRPHSDPDSSVRVLPDVRFGRPAVGGVSTEAVWELRESGEDDEEIAESLGLPIADVRWALSYETSLRAA